MKNRNTYRIFSLAMAIMLLFTSTGFSIDLHYCQGSLMGVSLLGEAKSCHEKKNTCSMHDNMELLEDQERECCTNVSYELEEIDTDYDLTAHAELTELQYKFVYSLIATFNGFPTHKVTHSSIPIIEEPLPSRDIYVLFESFLL